MPLASDFRCDHHLAFAVYAGWITIGAAQGAQVLQAGVLGVPQEDVSLAADIRLAHHLAFARLCRCTLQVPPGRVPRSV